MLFTFKLVAKYDLLLIQNPANASPDLQDDLSKANTICWIAEMVFIGSIHYEHVMLG